MNEDLKAIRNLLEKATAVATKTTDLDVGDAILERAREDMERKAATLNVLSMLRSSFVDYKVGGIVFPDQPFEAAYTALTRSVATAMQTYADLQAGIEGPDDEDGLPF